MERSSPLAAMQPQAIPLGHGHWSCGGNSSQAGFGDFGSRSFNFKDLSMGNKQTDYFALRPSRGASPTSSLAVDLSRNFHIDKSPQPPTPRRSLFNNPLLTSLNCNVSIPTPPPVASSSPAPDSDSMEISPLPHKAPYSTTITIQSPTPEPTPRDEGMLSSPALIPESPLVGLKPTVNERRRPTMSRPSLSRLKGLTTSAVPTRSAGGDVPPPFRFGGMPKFPLQTTAALEECFVESPEQSNFPSPLKSPIGLARPKSSHQRANALCQSFNHGSPLTTQNKRPTQSQRPRKQFRRSLSMFEHPIDVLNQQQQDHPPECGLQSVMDLDERPQLQLPHFLPEQDTIPRITKETMIDVLDGKYLQCYDSAMVIDCRFEYEYKGGHIDGAINFNDKEELAKKLFDQPSMLRTLLIFHCEYSAHRAPIAARFIRGEDRSTNAHQYPKLTYPEIYILDGGYSAFFKDHKIRCVPQNYVEMNDEAHVTACERGLGRMKQQRAKLGRAQTFAFGEHSETMQESPSTLNRQCSSFMTTMDISSDMSMDMALAETPVSKRWNSRRMASF